MCEYDSVEAYFQQICQTTAAAANSENDKVGAQAFEFWTTLAEEEQERVVKGLPSKNYMNLCKGELLELIFVGLLKINFEEDEDDDEWGHALSAACCLQKMSILLGNDLMDPVVQYVAKHIQSPNWKEKYASLMALGSITEGPDKQKFALVIVQALQNLLAMFQDQNGKVREAISWVMNRISEHHAEVLLDQNIIN
jgi:importin subunit beta-1